MAAKRIGRKELKEPDEFLTLTGQALEYAKQHERELGYVVVGLLALVALSLGVRSYRGWQQDKAESAFGAARRDYASQKFETAVGGFQRVSREWPSTTFGEMALVYEGNCYAELGKTKEAQDAFRGALGASRDPLVQQIAHYNLGLLAAKSGDKKTAADELGQAVKIEGPLRAAAWFSRLSGQQQFVEEIGEGMKAIDELSPEAREYVDAQIAAQSKAAPAPK